MGATKVRHLRMSDALWDAVKVRAAAEHTSATAWIVRVVVRSLKLSRSPEAELELMADGFDESGMTEAARALRDRARSIRGR